MCDLAAQVSMSPWFDPGRGSPRGRGPGPAGGLRERSAGRVRSLDRQRSRPDRPGTPRAPRAARALLHRCAHTRRARAAHRRRPPQAPRARTPGRRRRGLSRPPSPARPGQDGPDASPPVLARLRCSHPPTVDEAHAMARQAGLGRSLHEVLESLTPAEGLPEPTAATHGRAGAAPARPAPRRRPGAPRPRRAARRPGEAVAEGQEDGRKAGRKGVRRERQEEAEVEGFTRRITATRHASRSLVGGASTRGVRCRSSVVTRHGCRARRRRCRS